MNQSKPLDMQLVPKWFSRSKTRAPRFSIPLVERKRLLQMLDSVLDESLSCIVAPAGFGKSTLLSQWRDSLIARDIKCAWINLDENDREIRQFFAYLVFAFEDAGVPLGYLKSAAERGFVDMSSSAIITSLLSAIIDIEEHMVLVLDDYHRPASDEIDDFVRTLSEQCGDRIHIAIGSRKQVDINLPVLLAAGRAIEISASKLRFSDREVADAMGNDLDAQAIVALQDQVEGWPVAVQMTKLFSGIADYQIVPKSDFTSSHGHLADYLVTNVLDSQSPELREFLLETSVLESFNADLANAVCGHENSQQLIRQLRSLQALVVPLDDEQEWYRYHHLFSECLRDLLNRKDREGFIRSHCRAAKWCSENRMIAEAVNYACAIKDYDLSKQIINENSEWMRAEKFGGIGYFSSVLTRIPEDEAVKDPRILYCKSYVSILEGNFRDALHHRNAAELLIDRDGETSETLRDRLTIGTGLLFRTEYNRARKDSWLHKLLEMVEKFPTTSSTMDPKVHILCSLTLQSISYGDFKQARKYAQAADSDVETVIGIYCELNFGLLEFWTNNHNRARRRFSNALNGSIRIAGNRNNLKSMCDLFLAIISYWEGKVDQESDMILDQIINEIFEGDGGYDVFSFGLDTVVHDALIQNDHNRAQELVARLEKAIDRLAIARLAQFGQLLRLDCAVACNNLSEAERFFEQINDWLDGDDRHRENLGWYHRARASYSLARYLAALCQFGEALSMVDQGIDETDQLDVVLLGVCGNILKASILERANRQEEAITVLEGAIEDAARINCARAFAADVSDTLLAEAVSSVLDKTTAPAVKEFAGRLAISGTQKMFSSREEEVLQGLADGKSNKEIARELDVTDNTIKFHLRNIYRKLGVKKRVPAVEKAREIGIIQ